jgi:hypothetical protein
MQGFLCFNLIQIKVSGRRCPRMSEILKGRTMNSLIGAVVGILGLATSAAAQMPVAIVEDVQGKVDGIELMDYVAPGKVIKLGPKASVVLGYMKSCWRETITGGTVVVGSEQSMVHLSDIQRAKIACDTNAGQLSDREASQSAATTFRAMAPGRREASPPMPQLTIYGLSPVVEVSGSGTLVIERVDVPGERYTLPLKSESLQRGKFYDLAKAGKSLTAGGIYTASLGSRRTTFRIDSGAMPGATSIVGRLLRL